MDWKSHYQSRTVTKEEAIQTIQPHESILLAGMCNEPQTLVEELIAQKERLAKVTLHTMIQGSPCLYAEKENLEFFSIQHFLASPKLKLANQHGSSDYIPINISKIPQWLKQRRVDAVFIQTTPPNEKGYCSLGISVDFMKAAIKYGKKVIAQVNHEMPWTYGDTLVHVSEIDCFVKSDRPLLTIENRPLSEVEKKIGANVAELIPDGATFQIGIGNISESVLRHLDGKKELGVHSGTFSDGIIDLIESGVITNQHKRIHQGKIVSTSISGTKKLYDYVHNNPLFALFPVDYTHHINTLAKIDNFYSINSALEVDLTGQINSETVGNQQIAGVGGQMDFIHGSQISNGGKSIIALPSTAKNGTVSRITVKSENVTSLKSEIDYVVTEYGVASLFGKSLRERMNEMIAIAHPNFREELQFYFNKLL